MTDLEELRANAEAKLEKLLAKLDERHKTQLRAAIKKHGWNVPDEVWQTIQRDQEDEEIAAAILLLFTSADEWTTDAIKQQGVAAKGYSRREFMGYAFDAQKTVQDLAAQTTDTLRKRITRKVQDSQLTGPGSVGELTDEGIEAVLDDVFTPERRKGIAADQTTGAFSRGQRQAAERGDGASTEAGQSVTVRMLWVTERDFLVCPRCAPLDGKPEEVWGLVFPNGPGPEAHPNCRCALLPQIVVESAVAESRIIEHGGPGPHESGSGQDVHGSGGSSGPLTGKSLGDGKRPTIKKSSVPTDEDIDNAIAQFPQDIQGALKDTLRNTDLSDKYIDRLVNRKGADREKLNSLRAMLVARADDKRTRGAAARLIKTRQANELGSALVAKYGKPIFSGRSEAAYFDVVIGQNDGVKKTVRIRYASHAPIYDNSISSIYVNNEGPTHPSHYGGGKVRLVNAGGREAADVMAEIDKHVEEIRTATQESA